MRIFRIPIYQLIKIQKTMVKNCSIVNCISGLPKDREIRKSLNIKQASLFSVPKDATLLAQWSSVLKMNLRPNHHICDFHFKDEDIVKSFRHDFPDGTFQVIPRDRWTLLPNAIPVNSKPRKYDNENSAVEVHEQLQQSDRCSSIKQEPSLLSEKAVGLPTNEEKTKNGDSKNLDSIDSLSEQQLNLPHTPLNNEKTDVNSKQEFCNRVESHERPMTFKDLQSFSNVPPAWYYIRYENEIMFVHVDSLKFTEKLRMFINKDMSVMVSFNQHKKIDLKLKITCTADLSKLFQDMWQTSICAGTGIKNMRASASCYGAVPKNENYKSQRNSPRCKACRILRHRLLTKAAKQRYAATKKQLKSSEKKRKCLQKR